MAEKVIVIGGGVGGLSAAHELVHRGFEVEVYEQHCIPGGKARSVGVAGTGKDGRHDLPAEHGFRFFPGYYKHLIDTMAHIPFPWDTPTPQGAAADPPKRHWVVDCLTEVEEMSFASFRHRPIRMKTKLPNSLVGWIAAWRDYRSQPSMNLAPGEMRFYLSRLWQILTSCPERRDDQYEVIPWWDFLGAGERSLNYQRYLANMSRTLVAADPKRVSTRTNGNIYLQTLLGMAGDHADRVLDGPTNEVWIHPWIKHLLGMGVKYYVNAQAMKFHTSDGKVRGVTVKKSEHIPDWAKPDCMARVLECDRYGITRWEEVEDGKLHVSGDRYISAVPVEVMAGLVQADGGQAWRDGFTSTDIHLQSVGWSGLIDIDPELRHIVELSYSVRWMNGILFYLKDAVGRDTPANLPGHTIYVDAPFALTSIFQPQYWRADVNLSEYGDGTVTNVLSVDISDWMDGTGRIFGKPARDLIRTEVGEEVWVDLQGSLKHSPKTRLDDAARVYWHLDYDIIPTVQILLRNKEPLLVNRVNTWRLRPDADTKIPNLYLASDYVRTYTDLATMEGANEAARRAVNAILKDSGSGETPCQLWPLQEPEFLAPFRDYDLDRYNNGQPWKRRFPLRVRLRALWRFIKFMWRR